MKLSDFKDERAIEVVADLLGPIARIAGNAENEKARGGNKLQFVSALLKNNAADVKEMLAVLSEQDPAAYHCDAATVVLDVLDMLNDPALMRLFGLQGKTPPSSGSAPGNTEGGPSEAFSNTAPQG